MPDTNGGRMLTPPETRLANKAAVSPADRMYTPVGVKRRPAAPLLPPHERRRTGPRQLHETMHGFPRRRRGDPQRREPAVTSRQSASEADKLVRRYLAQLDAALRGVDATRREEIRAEVHRHIEQGRTGLDRDDVASVRALLSRVGDPDAIAASYWSVLQQPRSAWTWELELRPWVEKF